MDEEPDWAADDPEIAALLNFTPVPRGVERTDGWGPASQRGFIAWLAATGNRIAAARAVGKSESGAKQLRREDERGEFTAAWSRAIALYRSRNGATGQRPPAPPRPARELRDAGGRLAAAEPAPADPEENAALDEAAKTVVLQAMLPLYFLKLRAERECRLAGRVIEADFYVRQLAFIEIVLAIGGRAQELLEMMKQGDRHILQVVATPGSTLLEKARRAWWLEKGEADRPPPAPLGRHNEHYATGESTDYNAARDGDFGEWERRLAEKRRLAAEAQAEWERRARGDDPGEPCRASLGPAKDSSADSPGPLAASGEAGNDNDPDPEP